MDPKAGDISHEVFGRAQRPGLPLEVVFMADALTPREQQILEMHDADMRNVDIAKDLGISAGTVSNALVKALKKTNREDEVGSGGGNGGSTVAVGSSLNPEDIMKREGAKVIRRSHDTQKAVDDYPATFEEYLDSNREDLEKQYNARFETMVEQAEQSAEAAGKWRAVAETLGIDLEEVEKDSESEETANAVAAEAQAEADAEAEATADEDEDEGDQS